MNWLQFSLKTNHDNLDAWSDALTEAGAVAISIENNMHDPIYELNPEHKPMWQEVQLISLFTEDEDPLVIQKILASSIDANSLSKGTWAKITEQNWVQKSQENMQPMLFGDNLWVCPSWCEIPNPNAINIMLDPEMAFGTGSHATTALCLEWIAQNVTTGNIVVDYGCGSGILGIAAAKMGATTVYATDIDPLALEVSENNAQKNDVTLSTYLPEQMPAIKADVVIANILAMPLMGLAPTLVDLLKPGGTLVLSGILAEQTDMIQRHYSQWFKNIQINLKDEWARITVNS